jgi:adenosylcobinamide-GDP ribazoletransferase
MFKGFLILLSFFTRIPIGKYIKYDDQKFVKGLKIYCLVGLVISAFLSLAYFIGDFLQIIYIKGLIITIFYIIITGGIHLDGTSDTCDGLFSGRTGDKVFEIMSDSRVGAFGVISLILTIISQIILFSHIDIYSLILVPIVGRASLVVACFKAKYAKKSVGMGTLFVESIKYKELIINITIVIIVCALMPNYIMLIMSTIITFLLVLMIRRWINGKICGMTGDTCGFVTEMSQIIFMFMSLILSKLLI